MNKNNFYYKPSKVKGQIYMQIWKKENDKHTYMISLGSAEDCYNKLKNYMERLLVKEAEQS